MGESIIHYRAFAGGISGGGAAEGVVHILTLRHEGAAAMIRDARERIAVFFIALRQRHAVGFGELPQNKVSLWKSVALPEGKINLKTKYILSVYQLFLFIFSVHAIIVVNVIYLSNFSDYYPHRTKYRLKYQWSFYFPCRQNYHRMF